VVITRRTATVSRSAQPIGGKCRASIDDRQLTQPQAWAITLRCPHCGRAGTAIVSELGSVGQAESRLRIDCLSSGFVVVERRPRAGQDIRCSTCNSSALK
jgi:hypothetical protein